MPVESHDSTRAVPGSRLERSVNLPVDLLLRTPSFQDFSSRWENSPPGLLEWGGLWGSAKTLLTTACSKQGRKPLLVVAPDPPSADLALGDLKTFGAGA